MSTSRTSQQDGAGPPATSGRPASDGDYYYGSAYGDRMPPDTGGMIAGLTPKQIVRALLCKWWLLALAIAFGLSLATLYLHRAEPVYSAEAVLEMSIRRPRIMAQPGAMIDDGFAGWRIDELLNTRVRKLHGAETRAVAREMLTAQADLSREEREQVHQAIGSVSLHRQRDSHLVSVSARDQAPRIAALAANQYALAVLERSLQENRRESDQAVDWLQQQAAQQAEILERAEEALRSFRSRERMELMEVEKKMLEDAIINLSDELTAIEKKRVMAREVLAMLDAVQANPDLFGQLPESVPLHADILRAVAAWGSSVAQRDLLTARLTERHPQYIEQQRQVDSDRQRVSTVITRSRETAEANIQLQVQQAISLRSRVNEQLAEITTIEERLANVRTTYSSFERTRDSADVSFKGLLTRIEEARMAADENTSIIHLIEEARAPSAPVFPRRNRILMIGLLGGAVLGVGVVMGIYMLEDGIEGTESIERQLGIKVIGLIPHAAMEDPEALARVAMSKDYHTMVEAFANVRAMLESDTYRPYSRSILVTSTAPREGKTTSASNLAISLARAGHRTVLIGFDLRQPKGRPIFSIPDAHPSLAKAIGPHPSVPFDQLPFKVPSIPLWVVTSRHGREATASEILGSTSVAALLDWAKSSYDRVVIDSPPYSLIGDALVLGSRVDGVLLVCRPSITRMRALRHVARDFGESGARILGVLVNDIEFRKTSYFSNYHYYDNHAYRYSESYYSAPSDRDADTPVT